MLCYKLPKDVDTLQDVVVILFTKSDLPSILSAVNWIQNGLTEKNLSFHIAILEIGDEPLLEKPVMKHPFEKTSYTFFTTDHKNTPLQMASTFVSETSLKGKAFWIHSSDNLVLHSEKPFELLSSFLQNNELPDAILSDSAKIVSQKEWSHMFSQRASYKAKQKISKAIVEETDTCYKSNGQTTAVSYIVRCLEIIPSLFHNEKVPMFMIDSNEKPIAIDHAQTNSVERQSVTKGLAIGLPVITRESIEIQTEECHKVAEITSEKSKSKQIVSQPVLEKVPSISFNLDDYSRMFDSSPITNAIRYDDVPLMGWPVCHVISLPQRKDRRSFFAKTKFPFVVQYFNAVDKRPSGWQGRMDSQKMALSTIHEKLVWLCEDDVQFHLEDPVDELLDISKSAQLLQRLNEFNASPYDICIIEGSCDSSLLVGTSFFKVSEIHKVTSFVVKAQSQLKLLTFLEAKKSFQEAAQEFQIVSLHHLQFASERKTFSDIKNA